MSEGPKDEERRKQKDASYTSNPTLRTTTVLSTEVQKIVFDANSDMIRLGRGLVLHEKRLHDASWEVSISVQSRETTAGYCLKPANTAA